MFNKNQINKKDVYKWGIGAGIAEIAYVILVVLLMNFLDAFMSQQAGGTLAILSVLLLLVFSAAISGFFVFGYPAYLFLQKKYRQAVLTILTTFLTILVAFVAVLLFVFVI